MPFEWRGREIDGQSNGSDVCINFNGWYVRAHAVEYTWRAYMYIYTDFLQEFAINKMIWSEQTIWFQRPASSAAFPHTQYNKCMADCYKVTNRFVYRGPMSTLCERYYIIWVVACTLYKCACVRVCSRASLCH